VALYNNDKLCKKQGMVAEMYFTGMQCLVGCDLRKTQSTECLQLFL